MDLARIALAALFMLSAAAAHAPASAQTRRGAIHDNSVYCQNSPGMPARPGPGGYPGTGSQNPFGGECGPRPAAPPPATQRPTVQREIRLTTVAWISEHPNPFDAVPVGGGGMVGPAQVFAFRPDWVVKVYLGLIGTANPQWPARLDDVPNLRRARNFRAMLHARIVLTMDAATRAPVSARLVPGETILDPGWTPPFDRNRFPPVYLSFLLEWADPSLTAMRDATWHPGQLSRVSSFTAARHPNSVLPVAADERVLAGGLIRFRAGTHTDTVGVNVGSPNHVPWVWNEVALTHAQGRYWLRGAASAFPTTWWYVDGALVRCQARLADASFPVQGGLFGLGGTIDMARLRAGPALTSGAPVHGAGGARLAQSPDTPFTGPVSPRAHTVGPPAGPGHWRRGLDDPPVAGPPNGPEC